MPGAASLCCNTINTGLPTLCKGESLAEGKKNGDRGCGQYLELIGFLNDDFELGVLPQDWAAQLCNATLFLLFAGQWLLFFILLCKAKSLSVIQAWLVTLWSWLPVRGGSQEASGESISDRAAEKEEVMEQQTRQFCWKCQQEVCSLSSLRRSSVHPQGWGIVLHLVPVAFSTGMVGEDSSPLRLHHFSALQVCIEAWSGHLHQQMRESTASSPWAETGMKLVSASFGTGLYLGKGAGSWRA